MLYLFSNLLDVTRKNFHQNTRIFHWNMELKFLLNISVYVKLWVNTYVCVCIYIYIHTGKCKEGLLREKIVEGKLFLKTWFIYFLKSWYRLFFFNTLFWLQFAQWHLFFFHSNSVEAIFSESSIKAWNICLAGATILDFSKNPPKLKQKPNATT